MKVKHIHRCVEDDCQLNGGTIVDDANWIEFDSKKGIAKVYHDRGTVEVSIADILEISG